MSKTKKLLAGISTVALTSAMTGCSSDLPPEPETGDCYDWEWDDEEGVYYCDDDSSGYYRHYYYGGTYYKDKSTLQGSSSYKSYKNSSSFKGGSSGFGSSSSGFGG